MAFRFSKEEYSLAALMHNQYEEFADQRGWKTQDSCRLIGFYELPEANREVMLLLAREIIKYFKKQGRKKQ